MVSQVSFLLLVPLYSIQVENASQSLSRHFSGGNALDAEPRFLARSTRGRISQQRLVLRSFALPVRWELALGFGPGR